MKIIVQAGGLGSRMKALTACKPKALIPVKNRPILFHLFENCGSDDHDFIVIGDYKYDVLDRYITTFVKNRPVILVKASGKGNVAGIKQALEYVSDNEKVLLIWSDLILPQNFIKYLDQINLNHGCAVGTVDFHCSWRMEKQKIIHQEGDKNGLAGVYLFENKSLLSSLPEDGSFTTWLSTQDIPIVGVHIKDCMDIGTIEAYRKIETQEFRCRPYNNIEINVDSVIKTGLTNEAEQLIKREILWYHKAREYGVANVPDLLADTPLTLERIHGSNVFHTSLDDTQKEETLIKIVKALDNLHRFGKQPANSWDLYQEYFVKTISRLQGIMFSIPFSGEKEILINNKRCINILQNTQLFRELVLNTLMKTHYCLYHGDCQLTNTLLDNTGKIYFIDPRGYFGKTKIYGDVRYDWAKLYYAICGNFDQFNVKNFILDISEHEISYKIGSGGWEFLENKFFSLLPKEESVEREIKLIHIIAWLSLASHAWEDFDSMCVAFYNGTYLLQDWLETYYK